MMADATAADLGLLFAEEFGEIFKETNQDNEQ